MKSHSLLIYLPVALAGVGAGATFALWTSTGNEPPRAILTQDTAVIAPGPGHTPTLDRPLNLRLDEDLNSRNAENVAEASSPEPQQKQQSLRDYAAQKHAEKTPQRSEEMTSEASKPLNLDLPEANPDTLANVDNDAPVAEKLPTGRATQNGKTLEFEPAPEPDTRPKVQSYNLFNPDYGLRGFMKQGWVNQRFGLQGGLGLNDDRVIPTESDFRDDIAVGLGVIVAF